MKCKQLLGAVLALTMAFSSLNIVFSNEAVSDNTELVIEESITSDSALEATQPTAEQENETISETINQANFTETVIEENTFSGSELEINESNTEEENKTTSETIIQADLATYTTTYEVEGGYIYVNTDTGEITDCDTSVTSAVIPSEIDGVSVVNIGNYAFRSCNKLESIELPSGITSIGNEAFSGCSSLESIELPSEVTSIGRLAFNDCSNLTSITLSENLTSIGNSAFNECSSLTNIILPDGLTSIGNSAFFSCSSLTGITIPSNVTSIGTSAFYGCSSLSYIEVEEENENYCSQDGILFNKDISELMHYPAAKGDTSYEIPDSITVIDTAAFHQCSSLVNIGIPSSVTSIGSSAFRNCSSLESIEIPSGITSIDNYMFSSCSSLTSITIPDSVVEIGEGAFNQCSSLENIEIPSGVTNIGERITFSGCSSLISITIPSGVTSIGEGTFEKCSSLTNITIPSGVTSIGEEAFRSCYSLTSIDLPDSVTSIGNSAFSSCTSLLTIEIPDGITKIPYCAFDTCTSLTNVAIGSGVTSIIESAFSNCSSLTNIEIPSGVTSIGKNAFDQCSSLVSISIPDTVTSIGTEAFSDCSSLESIEIPSKITSISDYLFNDCSSLVSVTLPSGLKSIGERSFGGCEALESIEIPSKVTTIGYNAFGGCTSLISITIPSSVTSIGEWPFLDCDSLQKITVKSGNTKYKSVDGVLYNYDLTEILCYPIGSENTEYSILNGVTSIANGCFNRCKNITSIVLPDTVTSIGKQAFYHCTNLKSLTIPGNEISIEIYAFEGLNNLENLTIGQGALDYVNGYIGTCAWEDSRKNLKTVVLLDGVTNIGEKAFSSNSYITDLIIPSSVTNIASTAFTGCSYIENLTVGQTGLDYNWWYSSKSIKNVVLLDDVTSISESKFSGYTGLTDITIPNSVISIGTKAFYNCSSLKNIEIPSSVTNIEEYTFYGCSSLTDITIPDSIVSIGSYAFTNCTGLTSMFIPESITSIEEYTFSGCSSLAGITVPSSVESIADTAFEDCDKDLLVFYVEKGSYADTWATENGWMVNYGEQPTIYFDNTGSSTIDIDEYSEYNELFVTINRKSEGDDEVVVTSSNKEVAEVTAVEKSYLYVDDSTSYNLTLSLNGKGTTTLTATDTVTGVSASYTLTITGTGLEIVSVTYNDNIWSGGIGALDICVEFNKEISLLNGDITVFCENQNILNVEAIVDESKEYINWYKADEDDPNKIIISISENVEQTANTEIDGVDYIYNYLLSYKPITFYIDETVLTPVDSSVEFENLSFTVDLDDYNLDYPTDILSWKNKTYAFNTSNYGLNSAFDDRLNLGLFVLYHWRNNTDWNGSCYGMCALVSLIKNGQFDIRNINLNESVINTCDLPMPRFSENIGGVRDWVNYMHFLQSDKRIKEIKKYAFMPNMFSTEYESENWSGTQGDSQEILQVIIDNAKANNTNYIFEFAWVDPTTGDINKHAILPFSYYYDGTELMHKIVCYDPSIGTFSTVSINNALTNFTVNNSWTDSPIEVGYTDLTDFDNIFDLSVVKPTTYLSTYSSDLSATSEEDSSDGTKISLWANSDFEIKVGDNSLLYNDGTFSGDYGIINNLDIMANGDGSALLIFTVDDADTYVVSSNSDSLDCTLETSDTYASSQMSGNGLTATFDCKNSQIISEGNISEYTVALNYDDSNMIVVSGDNETEVVVSSGDEMSVSTESGGEITLDIVNDGEQTDSETISDSNSITVVKTETGLEVSSETQSTTETSSETTTETETSTETSTETTTETSTETSTETTTKTSSSSSGFGGGGGGSSSTCTIKLVPNNGVNSSTTYVKKNGILAEPDTPVYDGYTFTGWYTDSDCTTLYDFSAKVTSSFTLYGGWKVNSEDETEDTETENEAEEEEVQTETNESIIEKIVKVVIGSTIVAVETDGQESTYTMDTAPYIQSESNSTLVPLRFVTVAVYGDEVDNADSSDIVTWNSDTKTASITVGDDIISFTAGSEYMSINGKNVLMSNGVKAEITDGRMFIPFRALGEALGVEVDWDSTTKTAIYTAE